MFKFLEKKKDAELEASEDLVKGNNQQNINNIQCAQYFLPFSNRKIEAASRDHGRASAGNVKALR